MSKQFLESCTSCSQKILRIQSCLINQDWALFGWWNYSILLFYRKKKCPALQIQWFWWCGVRHFAEEFHFLLSKYVVFQLLKLSHCGQGASIKYVRTFLRLFRAPPPPCTQLYAFGLPPPPPCILFVWWHYLFTQEIVYVRTYYRHLTPPPPPVCTHTLLVKPPPPHHCVHTLWMPPQRTELIWVVGEYCHRLSNRYLLPIIKI